MHMLSKDTMEAWCANSQQIYPLNVPIKLDMGIKHMDANRQNHE